MLITKQTRSLIQMEYSTTKICISSRYLTVTLKINLKSMELLLKCGNYKKYEQMENKSLITPYKLYNNNIFFTNKSNVI